MSTLFGHEDIPAGVPIRTRDDLLAVFRRGEKPPDRFGVGIEYERLPVFRETGRAVPYAAAPGAPSVETFLERLAERPGWNAQRESGRVIALDSGGTRVTLEPGAQVELSGRVHRRLDDARDEVFRFAEVSGEIADALGLVFVGMGLHPFTEETRIGWVPKGRYRIMAPYLASRGHLAHSMMKATAGCQINLDYSSESDAMEKLRVAMGLSSLVTALCANSPLTRGQANGFLSKRSHIWGHTDPDRCGLLSFVFSGSAGYADYAAYALGVPMLFVVRDGEWVDMTGRTFGAYLDGDDRDLTPTLADWELHLTTLFPEVRLKSYVEVRGSDSATPDLILAQAALWKGILYDDAARRRAWELVKAAAFEQRLAFHRAVAREGLRAALAGRPALELAQEMVAIAARGLGKPEAGHLEPLRRLAVEEKASPAELLMRRWASWRDRDPRRLVEGLAGGPFP